MATDDDDREAERVHRREMRAGVYRGKLPPGAQAQLDRLIASDRETAKTIRLSLMVSAPSDCAVALAQEGTLYSLNDPPPLPFRGCERYPCCACCYVSHVPPEESERIHEGLLEALRALPRDQMITVANSIIVGFGGAPMKESDFPPDQRETPAAAPVGVLRAPSSIGIWRRIAKLFG